MYECAFPMLIEAWRAAFRAPNAPFVFVQLPAYVRQNDTALAELREGQLAAADRLDNVGFACTAEPRSTTDVRSTTSCAARSSPCGRPR